MSSQRILVADPVSERGLDILRNEPGFAVELKPGMSEAELIAAVANVDALVVRSGVKVTRAVIEAAPRLRVIGRAGVGVDNIDVPAASERGIVVMNTPAGNSISTAEHAFSLMLSLARAIPQAHTSVAAGRWERKRFSGVEIHNKTLAVLGMGRIGSEFARRAMAFGMRVLAYDPYLSASRAKLLRVELVNRIEDALAEADFITLHLPLTPETKHILNAERLAALKPGARIINCARGGLIDEQALVAALEDGPVAGAALDVFETEPPFANDPLLARQDVVLTPHLGASTAEAQETVGIEVAHAIRNYLVDGAVVNSVNMPSVDEKTLAQIGPYLRFGEMLGRLLSQIAPQRCEKLRIDYSGRLGELDTSLISRSILKGFLEKAIGAHQVNVVNATSLAQNLGLRLTESRPAQRSEYADLVEVTAATDGEAAEIAGTFFGGEARIVRVNGHRVEAKAEGTLLLLENTDKPGMIGAAGTLLGEKGVNIAGMTLSRERVGGRALVLLTLDSTPDQETLRALENVNGIEVARTLRTSAG